MGLTTLFGFLAAVLIGVTLGLIGGGGSILTVPALVYLVGVAPVPATSYSLFVVGLTAFVGAVAYMRQGLVSYRTAVVFGIPSFVAVFLTRRFIVPALPEQLFTVAGSAVTRDLGIMLLFAVLMIAASISMIRRNTREEITGDVEYNYPMIFVEGFVVGVLTGLVGAGGGFLIIPALVVLARLPMKRAVGTSLLIIAVKSLIGFTGDLVTMPIDWGFLALFSGFAIVGILLGSWLTRFVSGTRLKPLFGWFTLAMGVYIIGREIVFTTL
ncbi:MAG: sulfite exporter TauE/SafE family protein [Bacteroidetes bacterium]|nr:sulfite exporter TauE/SafE family protein [Bacteroidota bacterium]